MEFEYNGNLEETERVKLVAKEIIGAYPEISFEEAKTIAFLEEPITTSFDNIMYFKRLYNILFVVQDNKILFNKVLCDLNKVFRLCINDLNTKDANIDYMMNELNKFVLGERLDFPVVSEF